ncbi:ATP-binding protein [Lentisphaerota bacterium ZTH]|nr:ATP-binding protein [Lentisphaerota bacterium]WET05462.1 ATP-binding protein [Lentisphaerota bacterium ZTH]
MPDDIAIDWSSIVYRGVESEELDYKAAINWNRLNRTGRAKFARHCMALANTKGGYIVVGVGEDSAGQPSLFTGLSKEQAKSFDPTMIGNFINKYADPEIDFTLERPVVDGKRYAIFVIRRFADIPHVCAYGFNNELQQGVFYIRTADAASRPAYRASEIHALVQRALRNQRELLGKMIRGVLYENRDIPLKSEEGHFLEDSSNGKNYFLRRRHPHKKDTPAVLVQISVYPQEYITGKYSLSEIKRFAQGALSLLSEPDFVSEKDMQEAYFSNVALRSLPDNELKMWQFFQTGMFNYLEYWPAPHKIINYHWLVRFFAEAIVFFSRLYSEMDYEEEMLTIKVRLENVEGIALDGAPATRKHTPANTATCRIPDIRMSLQRTAADLASGYVFHTAKIIKEVCERFNLPDGRHRNLHRIIRGYLEKRS